MKPTVIADVDTGIDDALALIYLHQLHQSGAIELSVTTSAGNCSAADAARNSREVLAVSAPPSEISGRHPLLPVTPGATTPRELPLETTPETHGPHGLGNWVNYQVADVSNEDQSTAEDAVAHWARVCPSHVLVSGPATNLAVAVEQHPELLLDCQVVLMAGAFGYPGNTTPTAEWNAWVDPHALRYALEHWPAEAPKPVFVPLNVTEQVLLSPQQLAEWTAHLHAVGRDQLAELMTAALEFYFEFHQAVGVGNTAQIHDLAAAMVLLHDALNLDIALHGQPWHVAVEADSELTRGTTLAFDSHPPVAPESGPLAVQRSDNAIVIDQLSARNVLKEFFRVLG